MLFHLYLRLHLLVLLDLGSSPTLLPSLLSHAVETQYSPIMKYTHVSNVSVGYVPTEYTLWWSWADSNRRPTCLRFEGITTILLLSYVYF